MTTESPSSARFPTTAWSCVRQSQDATHPDVRTARNRLITCYWRPVFHFLRAKGYLLPAAEDLTADFFLLVLEKGWSTPADEQRGSFRNFLRKLVQRFAAKAVHAPKAQVRFEQGQVSIHSLMTDRDREYDPPAGLTPDEAFEQQWQVDLLAAVRQCLEDSYTAPSNPAERTHYLIFAARHLREDQQTPTQEELAQQFGVSRDVVRLALSSVSKKYQRLLRQELRDQGLSESEIDEEIRRLL